MELGVAFVIYSIQAELSKREYMALKKYANTSNARAIRVHTILSQPSIIIPNSV